MKTAEEPSGAAMLPVTEPRPERRGLGPLFFVLAALLVPANAFWVVASEAIYYSGHPTAGSLFYNVVFWLCLLLPVNALLRRLAPRAALTRAELLGLYVLLGVTSALCGHDTLQVIVPVITHAGQFASGGNNWGETVLPNLPSWLVVKDPAALAAYHGGHTPLYTAAALRPWVAPVLAWTALLATLTYVFLCLTVLFRRQWTENERLTFPLVQIPLELTEPGGPLFRKPLFWAGLLLAAGIQVWNGVSQLSPRVPPIRIGAEDYGHLFPTRPWSAVGWLPISFYPFAVAIGVLLPTDLSFSMWFFVVLGKLQKVASASAGYDTIPNFPFQPAQSLGAMAGIALFSLWAARQHLSAIGRHLLDPKNVPAPPGEEDEPISYRAAALGALVGVAALVGLALHLGMTPYLVALFFVLYLLLSVAVARMRAESGAPVHDLFGAGPDVVLPAALGPSNLAKADLRVLTLFFAISRSYRAHPMPIEMEGFKLLQSVPGGGTARGRSRTLFWLIVAGSVLGPLFGFWAVLHFCYEKGAANATGPANILLMFGKEAWGRYDGWAKSPAPPQSGQWFGLFGGTAFALALYGLRAVLPGFPLHPVGYALSSSWGMLMVWFPMFLAWGVKVVLLRFGGLGTYRKALPFVFGVIVGECLAGSVWNLLGILTDIPTYDFNP